MNFHSATVGRTYGTRLFSNPLVTGLLQLSLLPFVGNPNSPTRFRNGLDVYKTLIINSLKEF
jgi:hypothetical protein